MSSISQRVFFSLCSAGIYNKRDGYERTVRSEFETIKKLVEEEVKTGEEEYEKQYSNT
jgi:hypothetical protein